LLCCSATTSICTSFSAIATIAGRRWLPRSEPKVIVVVGTVAALFAQGAPAASTLPLRADLTGSFAFGPCPADAPAGALCLSDEVSGVMSHLGASTGSFEVVFDLARFVDGCGPISKRGSFVAADGDRLDIVARGTFCFTTLVASYTYTVTGGSARFTGATGTGTWLVPPPATFDGVAGQGDELLDGTISY
jgi:hypothetical protein